MPVPGYDPDDLDRYLAQRLEARDPDEFLNEDEKRRYENGESLTDLLSDEEIRRLMDGNDAAA